MRKRRRGKGKRKEMEERDERKATDFMSKIQKRIKGVGWTQCRKEREKR